MRDDELTRVPKSIEPWRVLEFLESLGITPKDTYETTFGVRAVTVRLYATDETGHRYLGEDGNAAEHVVSVQYVGPWEKPAAAAIVNAEEYRGCSATFPGTTGVLACEIPPDHREMHAAHESGVLHRW